MSRILAMIAGIISLLVALWFLGWLMISLNQAPLWIIIVATMGMMIYDFYQSLGEH
ncbi:hypothetical protein [Ferruginivarius sediminum]|uniref:hypothetical protein n=1 Tax=Ferruginivarius sediminum TaxID=2661937 RepID=UPI0012939DFE|nr:hypothetical protein [Ferruginivarius sediminum]